MALGTTGIAGIAGFGLIASLWGKIVGYAKKLQRLLIAEVDLNSDVLRDGLCYYLTENGKPSITARYAYNVLQLYSKDKDGAFQFNKKIVRSLPSSNTLYFVGKKFIWVDGGDVSSAKISFLRFLFNREALLKEFFDYYETYNHIKKSEKKEIVDSNRPSYRYKVVHIGGGGDSRTSGSDSDAPTEASSNSSGDCFEATKDIAYPLKGDSLKGMYNATPNTQTINMHLSESMKTILGDIDKWRSMRDWFVDRDLPWKRGVLLHGVPGNGKTTFVRTVAKWCNMPVYSLNLNGMGNRDLEDAFYKASNNYPSIILIEDIDAVFVGRENVTEKSGVEKGVSFDSLLNAIDGVQQMFGIVTMVTTNYIDKLDPALGGTYGLETISKKPSRPGRIDVSVEVISPDREGRTHIANRILKDWPEVIEEIVDDGDGDTGAQFEEKCKSYAVARFWRELDERDVSGMVMEHGDDYADYDDGIELCEETVDEDEYVTEGR